MYTQTKAETSPLQVKRQVPPRHGCLNKVAQFQRDSVETILSSAQLSQVLLAVPCGHTLAAPALLR